MIAIFWFNSDRDFVTSFSWFDLYIQHGSVDKTFNIKTMSAIYYSTANLDSKLGRKFFPEVDLHGGTSVPGVLPPPRLFSSGDRLRRLLSKTR